ncbi:efflux RND transporter periplasmic adaptor subunit [Rhizobium sp. ZPR3]|uniref:Efflux RND transporter periplasmic adaptor subunit n=2 Tax=unclassified Rhizobium TaxID=2613769 RepID=A0AAU7SR40_9HYPH
MAPQLYASDLIGICLTGRSGTWKLIGFGLKGSLRNMPRLRTTYAAATLCMVMLGACTEQSASQKPPTPEPSVAVVEVKPERLPVVSELPGRISPMMTAAIRPRVTGIVLKRVFEQGSTVRVGDVLYVLDQEPFKAKVRSAQATLDSANAAQQLASVKAVRQQELRKNNVTSAEDAESAVAALSQSDADVERAEADLQTAQLDLQYTEVRSPISGRIGRALVTEGALVSPTSDVMATVAQIDPVYADFSQPADKLIALKNAVAQGQLNADPSQNVPMKLTAESGKVYTHDGKLLFSEASVNSATGQVILRGEFPNPSMDLLPGMYVRGRIEQASLNKALAVPQQAVQHNTAGKAQLFVVDGENKIEVRDVTVGWAVDGRWVIINGLNGGEEVVVEGFQKITPGAKVKTAPWVAPQMSRGLQQAKG